MIRQVKPHRLRCSYSFGQLIQTQRKNVFYRSYSSTQTERRTGTNFNSLHYFAMSLGCASSLLAIYYIYPSEKSNGNINTGILHNFSMISDVPNTAADIVPTSLIEDIVLPIDRANNKAKCEENSKLLSNNNINTRHEFKEEIEKNVDTSDISRNKSMHDISKENRRDVNSIPLENIESNITNGLNGDISNSDQYYMVDRSMFPIGKDMITSRINPRTKELPIEDGKSISNDSSTSDNFSININQTEIESVEEIVNTDTNAVGLPEQLLEEELKQAERDNVREFNNTDEVLNELLGSELEYINEDRSVNLTYSEPEAETECILSSVNREFENDVSNETQLDDSCNDRNIYKKDSNLGQVLGGNVNYVGRSLEDEKSILNETENIHYSSSQDENVEQEMVTTLDNNKVEEANSHEALITDSNLGETSSREIKQKTERISDDQKEIEKRYAPADNKNESGKLCFDNVQRYCVERHGDTINDEIEIREGDVNICRLDTGEINWDSPSLGNLTHGPCGEEFRVAFSCYVYSAMDPKGSECSEKFQLMQSCFMKHPDYYSDRLETGERENTREK